MAEPFAIKAGAREITVANRSAQTRANAASEIRPLLVISVRLISVVAINQVLPMD